MKSIFLYAFAAANLVCCPLVSEAAKTNIVNTGNFFFDPARLVISAGDSVRWTNVALTAHDTTHKPTNGPVLWANNMTRNTSFQFTFTNTGFYPYRCEQHADFNQTGAVTVVSVHLKALGFLQDGSAEFSISGGRPGLRAVAERSTDLISWVPFRTNTFPAGNSITINEPGAAQAPARFYRSRILQP